ncbi:MAG: hypothetical protein WDN49_16675 [Acetobacteraceae bacterium]
MDADEVVRALVPLMEKGDVLATRSPATPAASFLPRPARCTGGMGRRWSAAWSWMWAMAATSASTWPGAPSPPASGPIRWGADMHGYNVRVPNGGEVSSNPFFGVAPFNLTNAMTKLLALGMTLPDML